MSTKTKRKTASAARKGGANPKSTRVTKTREQVKAPRTDTKQAQMLKMLGSRSGASIPAIMAETGWQEHSIRGFLSAVVRKRLGLNLVSEVKSGTRVYRIVSEGKGRKGARS